MFDVPRYLLGQFCGYSQEVATVCWRISCDASECSLLSPRQPLTKSAEKIHMQRIDINRMHPNAEQNQKNEAYPIRTDDFLISHRVLESNYLAN